MRFQEPQTSAGCSRDWRLPSTRQQRTLLPAHATPLKRGCITLATAQGAAPHCPQFPVHVPAGNWMCSPTLCSGERPRCPSLASQGPCTQGSQLVPVTARAVPKHPGNRDATRSPSNSSGMQGDEALQGCVLQPFSHCSGDCCDPPSGLGTVPLPAAYLLQVENHPLQDGVEGLPAALPSGCCREERAAQTSAQNRAGEQPPPILLQPALQCTSPPRDRQHGRTVPAHLSPCRPCGWQMVLLAGGPALCWAPPVPPCTPCLAACARLHHCPRARAWGHAGGAACQVMLATSNQS